MNKSSDSLIAGIIGIIFAFSVKGLISLGLEPLLSFSSRLEAASI
jgi:hypothetical protein